MDRGSGKPSAPVVFLSGNGPLVEVLQDALSDAGGGGKVFVRDVKQYVKQYGRSRMSVPPEHLLLFDEAQRAWDADHVARKHHGQAPRSEPEFAERIPEWCVVVGLIGTGQEIHAGEHGGIVQWRRAVEGCRDPDAWTIHAPAERLVRVIELSSFSYGTAASCLSACIRSYLGGCVPRYLNSTLLIVDEVGFRPLDRHEANQFFRLVAARYALAPAIAT